MESYGALLKKTREAKNGDLDLIAHEISIEKRYLIGLEEEDDSALPGSAYLKGFLRNYAIYLELDPEYVLKLYHNKELQESGVPEGLYEPIRSTRNLLPVIIPVALLVCIIGIISSLLIVKKYNIKDDNVVVSSKLKNRSFELTDKKFQQRVYKGDQFLIPTGNNNQIVVNVSSTLKSLGLAMPSGTYYVDLSEESELDVDGDNASDLIVYVSDISSTDESRGAEVSILLYHGLAGQESALSDADVANITAASEVNPKHIQRVLVEDNRAYPFTINANFRDACLFRDKVDRERSVEGYFAKGDLFTATPHNGIRLWMSNSNSVKFTIIADSRTYDLEMGAAGKVLVEDIKWIKYKLVVIEID